MTKKYRDAETGRYVTKDYAKANPKTTVSETDKSESKGSDGGKNKKGN